MIILLIEGNSAVQSFLALSSARMRYQEQRRLFCPCGQNLPAVRGLCRSCYRSATHSRQYFSGLRGEILERDGHQCRACGSSARLHVHHRKPGVNDHAWLITVCARCHARLHRLAAVRIWIPELLVALWIEQHPGAPVQLQLPVAA
jgi:5-methylcytosine-specific restriction endonuclease McrA